METAQTVLKWAASGLLITAGAAGGLLYYYQTALIYPSNIPQGSRTAVPTPSELGMPFEDVKLVTPDGVRIRAFLISQPESEKPSLRPTVLYLHANAGNVGHRLPIVKVIWSKMGANVLALSYRGYGLSEGSANERGLRLDAQTALDYLVSHPTLDKAPIFIYGQSIGGAVAIDLAARNGTRIQGLILENTFLSLPKLVPVLMPYLTPFIPLLLHQIWPSDVSLAKLDPSVPVLFLSGGKDELIPPSHMKGLFEICKSGRKEWKVFAEGTHNDTCLQPHYFSAIATFLSSIVPPLSPSPPVPSVASAAELSPPSEDLSVSTASLSSTSSEKDYEMVSRTEARSLDPKGVLEALEGEVEEKLRRVGEKL